LENVIGGGGRGDIVGEPAKWIKVATDTFEDEKIDLIEGMPRGEKIIIIWFKILLLAGKCNSGGYLLLQDELPFTAKMLARRFNQELSIVNQALKAFERYKMIQRTENGIYVTNFNKHQDLDKMNQKRVQDRERKQKQRAKEKSLNEDLEEEAEEDMSRVTSQKNECDNICDKERDSSYSSSISRSNNTNLIILKNKSYIDFFNNNFHAITDYEQKILVTYENKGINAEVITLALKEAVEENAKDMKYVKKILDRWLMGNILTVAAVILDKAEFEKKKNAAKGVNRKASDKTSTFNNFEQRNYDFDSLEKKLLGWEKING
jgi:predicted phage replisome organizer